MTIWKPGMKAACLKVKGWDAIRTDASVLNQYPQYPNIYTVTSVDCTDGIIFLTLEEFQDVPENRLLPPGFDSDGFRPVVERKTDISSLEALLQNPHVRIEETV